MRFFVVFVFIPVYPCLFNIFCLRTLITARKQQDDLLAFDSIIDSEPWAKVYTQFVNSISEFLRITEIAEADTADSTADNSSHLRSESIQPVTVRFPPISSDKDPDFSCFKFVQLACSFAATTEYFAK